MNFEKAKDFLKRFVSYEGMARIPYSDEVFDLQRVKDFLREYGVAYEKLKYIHVAGSKGKGSTCAFIANYLLSDGYKIGLYTSPHLFEVTERIWLNGRSIGKREFVQYVAELRDFMNRMGRDFGLNFLPKLTYFEILTVLALKCFVDHGVDYAVLEVGLGGRLDATNIVRPVLSILTAVELEHTEVLGNTLAEILNEKLGIVKEGVRVLVGQRVALKLIKQKLGKKRDVFYVKDFKTVFSEKNFSNTARFHNACTASAALKILLKKVDEKKFLKIATKLKLPGRFDVRKLAGKTVIFDVAHTKNSIGNLVTALKNNFPNQSFVFLVAIMKGKDVKSILKIIGRVAEKIIFTDAHEVRGILANELQKLADKCNLQCKNESIVNAEIAFTNLLKRTKKNRLLVVTGSHFLVGKLLPKRIWAQVLR